MTLTFENDNDVIVYALEKIVSYAREYQYFFVANCTWWIASIIGLVESLQRYIDNLALRQPTIVREISTVPRDIARNVSVESDKMSPEESVDSYVTDPLRRTRKGRVNPLHKSKKQLKKPIRAKARHNKKLTNICEEIISNRRQG